MGLGSIITRAFISGAIRAVAEAAREQARIERAAKQSSKTFREIASVATKEVSLPTTVISGPKALRLMAIIDGLLEQTRDEWLPAYRASLEADSATFDQAQEDLNNNLRMVRSHLMQMGFSYDWEFAGCVSDIHLELMIHKALPEAWKEWNHEGTRGSSLELFSYTF